MKYNLTYGFFDMLASITQVQNRFSLYSFWTKRKWLKITQFLFLFGNFKRQSWRPNFRIDMNQVTNLKSLGLIWKKIANLVGVTASFWSPYFYNRPFCGRRRCKTSICISCCRSRWFTYTNPTSSIGPFAMFAKSINDFTISFGAFPLFIIPFTREMHWPTPVSTVLTNWMLGKFVSRVYVHFY